MTPLLIILLLPHLSIAATLTDGSSHQDTATGLLVAGGWNADMSVEFWSPELHCDLPQLDRWMEDGPTLNTVQGKPPAVQAKVVACYDRGCDQFTGGKWVHLQNTLGDRNVHTSVVIGSNILLLGGRSTPVHTELMPVDGGVSVPGFNLQPSRKEHCSIKTGESSVVITGGHETYPDITEYSGLGPGEELAKRDFPMLTHGRANHACGLYENDGSQFLIVTGGNDYGGTISNTEVYNYSQGDTGTWRVVGELPSGRSGIRGSSIAGVFHVLGGLEYNDGHHFTEIIAFDPISETWAVVGNLNQGRGWHAVTEVAVASVEKYCTAAP